MIFIFIIFVGVCDFYSCQLLAVALFKLAPNDGISIASVHVVVTVPIKNNGVLFVLQDSHCEWLIKAKNDSQFITLRFQTLATECSYDYVFVYDGDSFRSPLLGSFSGKTEPQQVMATSGSVSLTSFASEIAIYFLPNGCDIGIYSANHVSVK